MSRRRSTRVLDVYLGRVLVGRLVRGTGGDLSFQYEADWIARGDALPVSLSLPLQASAHTGSIVSAYFDNLLPDNDAIRERIAAREGADSTRPFDLLSAIGRDCVGALRFLPEGTDPGDPTGVTAHVVDEAEIARRLRLLKLAPLGREDTDQDFRISIAGAQDKTALLRLPNGSWAIPDGDTPTSHILKPPIGKTHGELDLSDSVENEWLSLAFCRAFGLPVANAEMAQFEDVKALVVERFDRRWHDGMLFRLPQEDLCQALGYPWSRKYEDKGGPGIVRILDFLTRSNDPDTDREMFLRAQIVFWLMAAPDGHAKNFSIFLRPGGFRSTPLYDVMSSAPYSTRQSPFHKKKVRLAMAVGVGRHYKVDEIAGRNWLQTADAARLPASMCARIIEEIHDRVDPAIEAVAAQLPPNIPGPMFDAIRAAIRSRKGRLESTV